MINKLKHIIREEIEEFDWIRELEPEAVYLSRPSRYRKNGTPMEKLLNKLDLAYYLEEPEINWTVRGEQRVGSVITDDHLADGGIYYIWLGDMGPSARLNILKKLERMGFSFINLRSRNRMKAKKNMYYITISPRDTNTLLTNLPTNTNKLTSLAQFEKSLTFINVKQFNTEEFVNKI